VQTAVKGEHFEVGDLSASDLSAALAYYRTVGGVRYKRPFSVAALIEKQR
jgi:hypothetical protein